ncbi:Dioxygenase [Phytophthora infestans]|uniref:Dioxygenase n=1 Tax=Phytophthora infestans TaxID=4787 RepID=A0A833SY42_PHYIN|nr:Dioxygenase [Phytophthora infestans]KAF4136872.1 Dioxygenase [Phytophthora infestans]
MLFTLVSLAVLVMTISAHSVQQPHTQSVMHFEQRRLFQADSHRLLQACKDSAQARRLQERSVARRAFTLENLQARRRLGGGDGVQLDTPTEHQSSLVIDNVHDVNASDLFGSDVKCVLEPEVTEGPYYVNGELIRQDVTEDQEGVKLYAELQFVDVNTCEPVHNLYVDFWHCNATGVYSGVVANGNGDISDASNINNTAFRGLAPTDEDGIVSFTSVFPGHYTGRATHIHILGSYNGTVLQNNTYSGGVGAHVGQIYFDQDLISKVEATDVYATNKQRLTLNADDSIYSASTRTGSDPIMEYTLLGDSVEDGVLAWISVGVDMTLAKNVRTASTITANGGVANGGRHNE